MIIKTLTAGLAAALLAATAAVAAPPTALEKAELSMLSPAKQKEVLARATGGNTVDGVIETMLLNQISDEFAQGNVVGMDFDDAVFVVRGPKGDVRVYEVDTFNLILKDPNK
jgi:hypothetical protein